MEIHNDRGRRFYTTVEGGDAHILYRWGSNNSYDLFATCLYVQSWFRKHPEAGDILEKSASDPIISFY